MLRPFRTQALAPAGAPHMHAADLDVRAQSPVELDQPPVARGLHEALMERRFRRMCSEASAWSPARGRASSPERRRESWSGVMRATSASAARSSSAHLISKTSAISSADTPLTKVGTS